MTVCGEGCVFEPAAFNQLVQEGDAGARFIDDGRHVHGSGEGGRHLRDQVVKVRADERGAVAVVQQFL